MPRIIVRAEPDAQGQAPILMQEWVRPSDLESELFSAHLIERVGWAVVDADELEAVRAPA